MENLQCLPIGTIIPGTTYRIEKVLGQGSFGITYRVYDTVFEDVYALKEFFPQDLSDRNSSVSLMLETPSRKVEQFEMLKKKFISEAKSLKACQHPGIVNIRMFINSMDTVYYLMDFIDGETLSKKYTGKPLVAAEAIAMIQSIAEPLKHIHKKNIVHFDLNPNNVMVRSDGSIVLIDFGFAKRYDQSGNQMSSLLVAGGTMGYIAPEQVGGVIKEFTPRTDIYALGGILYFLLTGHAPVSYQTILQDDSALLDELPEKFHSFFQKAMALRVKDRFASVDEFIDGLSGIFKEDSKDEILYERIPRKDGKWNFINSNGEYLSGQWFENTCSFSEGWAKVRLDGRWNFVNANGKYLSEQWFEEVESFSKGWAKVRLTDKWNFINSTGNYLSEQWFEFRGSFLEGWANVKLDGKWNFVNADGEYLSEQWFEDTGSFSEGWAAAKLDGRWNFVNADGKYLSDQWFEDTGSFSEGWAEVKLDSKWNFINPNGKYLSLQWFEDSYSFCGKITMVKLYGEWHFIKANSTYIIKKDSDNSFDFEEVHRLSNFVILVKWRGKYLFMNPNKFKLVIHESFDDALFCSDKGWVRVRLNYKWNLIDFNGKYWSDQWFEYVGTPSDGWVKVKLDGEYNYINSNGKYLSNQWFKEANSFIDGWAVVRFNGNIYFINTEGKLVEMENEHFILDFEELLGI